jgi:hypothetical protein
MTLAEAKCADEDVQRAIDRMRSLRDGDIGVVEAVACGRRAVPALRELLFEREPSGIYQPRCWAARALSTLGAYEVLFEFLGMRQEASAPVERAGDDAVINSAARLLSVLREERVFRLLLCLAEHRLRPGVVGALAVFGREESIPHLVNALAEDDCRLLAEPALVGFGGRARGELLKAATTPSPSEESESETSIRKRAGALSLLIEMGVPQKLWFSLRHLISNQCPRIALLACELCLRIAPEKEWGGAVRRLVSLLQHADWKLEGEVEECLVRFYPKAAKTISAMRQSGIVDAADESAPFRTCEILLRIREGSARRHFRERARR